jgi:glycosyltransferase involved in cell wall biosynthesis
MKIAFILPGRGSSGGVRCISLVGKYLRDRHHLVRLFYRKPQRDLRDWARVIQGTMFYRSAPDWIRQFDGPVHAFEDLCQFEFDPDEILVAVGMAECAQLGLLASLPNPKVQYLHGSTPSAPQQVDKALSLSFPKIVVASYLKDLVESRGRGRDVLAVIHNGVDLNDYFPSVPESQRDGVGTIFASDPVKGPETILRALDRLAQVRREVPVRVFSTERRPKQIPASNYVRHPTLEQAREIYSRSLVWVVASRSEGFSMPVLEAMACGCVVVATDCGGPKDIVADGVNGFLVPVGDADAIVGRVQLLLDNSDLRDRMQQEALRSARNFTWKKCVDELERTLSGIAGEAAVQSTKDCTNPRTFSRGFSGRPVIGPVADRRLSGSQEL